MGTVNMRVIIYDIETFKGFFLFCGLDLLTGVRHVYTVESIDAMIRFIEDHKDYHFVGYNNVRFDAQVMEYIIRNNKYWFNLNYQQIEERIHGFAQDVIHDQEYEAFPPYREKDLSFKQIDLLKIHHFDNLNRRAALKWIAFMIDAEDIEELPFPHFKDLFSEDEKRRATDYCWKDVDVTKKFYEYTIGDCDHEFYQGKNKIQDRLDIIEELKFPDEAINYANVKLGDEINKKTYCLIKGIDERQLYAIRKARKPTRKITFGDCIPSYIQFVTPEMQEFLEKMRPVRVNLNGKKQFFPLEFRGIKYVIAQGGIHTEDPPRVIRVLSTEILRDADVGSQHPTAIIKRRLYPDHLGPEWLIGYESQRSRRVGYKAQAETSRRYKGLSETFKDALNGGGFGKTIEKTNWQYGPEVGFGCTIGNQFEILLLVEALETRGIHVISANTDGVVALFGRELEENYKQACAWWEETVGNTGDMGRLEFTDFEVLAQENVNNYIAVKKGGKIKLKGRFVVDCEVHKNNTKDLGRIERKAIVDYFSKGVPVEQTVRNSRNIYEFCIGVKSTREYHYETVSKRTTVEEYKRIVRFYISNEGYKLIKVKNDDSDATGAEVTRIADGHLVTIFNKFVQKPWDQYGIDYDYYINSANSVIRKIEGVNTEENPQQMSLF